MTESTSNRGDNGGRDSGGAAEAHYQVVINHEEQAAVWPVGMDLPDGWRATGKTGTKDECIAYVRTIWTDLRPLSARKKKPDKHAGEQ